jgi:hypothetical protein
MENKIVPGIGGRSRTLKLGGGTLFDAGGPGAALRPPGGPGRNTGGGPGGEAPKIISHKSFSLLFCHYKSSKIDS